MNRAPSIAATAVKTKQAPQEPWFLTAVTAPAASQSTDNGYAGDGEGVGELEATVGIGVGSAEGSGLGLGVGENEGKLEGRLDGILVGEVVGLTVGILDGILVDLVVGFVVGEVDGADVGDVASRCHESGFSEQRNSVTFGNVFIDTKNNQDTYQ